MPETVTARLEPLTIPTYGMGKPEKNPLFFEKRVYQGSCGKVYPVPFIDKVFQDDPPKPVTYQAVRMENEYLRMVTLPEIGGRIFLGQDKTNQDYDFFYRQDVIKPALVGLAGPWISGGVEFNWPQHHRPGTYLPTDVEIENEGDGMVTVWHSEHDPLQRMKGMHGIRIRPGSNLIELRARLYNRTAHTQTFLWWANVAARVHEQYQSFFPTDVHYVADHAVRAMSSFPEAWNDYYGVNYAERKGANDLRWFKNIPVPTSYMVCQTEDDFFGGYDFEAEGGFIHVANRHISPGKKQWTWGNHAFGWAWDRELTDPSGDNGQVAPYVELMAGVYTDNQPDFSYLVPYETKTFSQFWWPYKGLGPVQQANQLAAVRMVVEDDRRIDLGLAVSRPMENLHLMVRYQDRVLYEERVSVSPEQPWQHRGLTFEGDSETALSIWVLDADGRAVIGFRPPEKTTRVRERTQATEPPQPEDIQSIEELYLTGEHLEQYRHPTRYPAPYWREALERDPMDVRSNIALGRLLLGQGCLEQASGHFETAIKRLTARHPNPETGEAHYFLGLSLRYRGQFDAAYTAFYKATWNYAWRGQAYYELACIDMRHGKYTTAIEHLEASLETLAQNNKARVAMAICLRKTGNANEAVSVLESLRKLDPLDHWMLAELSRIKDGKACMSGASRNDAQTVLDVVFDYADCGCFEDARMILEAHHANAVNPVNVPNPLERASLTHYTLAWIAEMEGDQDAAGRLLDETSCCPPDYCFPSRLHEMIVLEWVLQRRPEEAVAAYGLGNFHYDCKRHADAIQAWEQARDADASIPTVHRNLGIAYWNTRRDGEAARQSYMKALEADPADARLVVEYVQLGAKIGDRARERLGFLERHMERVLERDDACVELAALYNDTDQPQKALDLLLSRHFHPWEGGEGKVLRQYTRACLLLGQSALDDEKAEQALAHFQAALETPDQLGEKYHLHQAKADVLYWQGTACRALGREEAAVEAFTMAADESGDFEGMAVTAYSEVTLFKARALHALGRKAEAVEVLKAVLAYALAELEVPAKIDYFATSLPNLLVFEEDLESVKAATMNRLADLARSELDALS